MADPRSSLTPFARDYWQKNFIIPSEVLDQGTLRSMSVADNRGGEIVTLISNGKTYAWAPDEVAADDDDQYIEPDVLAGNGRWRVVGGSSGGVTFGSSVVSVGTGGNYATLALALAALPTGGKIIMLPGNHAFAAGVTIAADQHVDLEGCGVGKTSLTMTGAITLISLGDAFFRARNFQVKGDAGVSEQKFVRYTAVTNAKSAVIENVLVGDGDGLVTNSIRTFLDANLIQRPTWINDCVIGLQCVAAPTTSYLWYFNTHQIFMRGTKVYGHVNTSGAPATIAHGCRIVATDGHMALGSTGSFYSSCHVETTGNVTFAGGSRMSNCTIVSALFAIQGGTYTACSITSFVSPNGSDVKMFGGAIVGTFSASTGVHRCVLRDVDLAGATVIFNDSTDNVVDGFHNATITETGTSDRNRFSRASGTSTVTLLGANSVFVDAAQAIPFGALRTNGTPGTYGTSGVPYIALAKAGTEEYVEFDFIARGTKAVIDLLYAPAADNGGDVVWSIETKRTADAGNPDSARSAGANMTITPGAGTTRKAVYGTSQATMAFTTVIGDHVLVRLVRKDVAGDTHTASMRVLGVRVR